MTEQDAQQLVAVRRAHLYLMDLSLQAVGHMIAPLSGEQATTLRDGPDGWTITEVLGHLRDFDGFFRGRAIMMAEQDYPNLPAYDHEALAIERRYNEQDFRAVYEELVQSRAETRAFFAALSPEGWARAGVHPETGHFTMTNAVMQVGIHEVSHVDQIAKILAGGNS